MFLNGRDWLLLAEMLDGGGWFLFLFLVLVFIGFLSTAAVLLGRVSRENRRMEPGQVWLNLIPLLNLVWLVVTIERVGESIRNEFIAREMDRPNESYGKPTGLTALVLFAAVVFPPAAVITWPFALIYSLVYWFQLNGYLRRLRKTAARSYTPPTDEGW